VAFLEEFAGNVHQESNRRETVDLRQDQELLNILWEMLSSLPCVEGSFEQLEAIVRIAKVRGNNQTPGEIKELSLKL